MAQQVQSSGWQSLRVVVEGLAVAGLLWMAKSISNQNESLARLQVQIATLQVTVAGVPQIQASMAAAQVQILEHERRLNQLESKK